MHSDSNNMSHIPTADPYSKFLQHVEKPSIIVTPQTSTDNKVIWKARCDKLKLSILNFDAFAHYFMEKLAAQKSTAMDRLQAADRIVKDFYSDFINGTSDPETKPIGRIGVMPQQHTPLLVHPTILVSKLVVSKARQRRHSFRRHKDEEVCGGDENWSVEGLKNARKKGQMSSEDLCNMLGTLHGPLSRDEQHRKEHHPRRRSTPDKRK